MKQIEKRIQYLETKEPERSELNFSCMGWIEIIRMRDLIKEDQLSDIEHEELELLYNKAKRVALSEFLDQYDKPLHFDLRTVFNDFKDYQLKYCRTDSMGHAIRPAYPQFQKLLTNQRYHNENN